MAYVTIPSSSVDADSPLDETLMTQIKDNLDDLDTRAVTNGDTHDHSAGDGNQIPQGGIANNAVGQGELTTAYDSNSTSISAGATGTVALSAQEYAFFPQVQSNDAGANMDFNKFIRTSIGNSYIRLQAQFTNNAGSSKNAFVRQRYVQASPPYTPFSTDEVPLFIYAKINKSTSDVLSVSIAEDPTWALDNRTKIDPYKIKLKDGVKCIESIVLPHGVLDARADITKLQENMSALKNPEYVYTELTQAVKNQGMHTIPHPFMGDYDPQTEEIILLDPCSDLCWDFYNLKNNYDDGMTHIAELLYNKDLLFENIQKEGLVMPNGLKAVGMRMK